MVEPPPGPKTRKEIKNRLLMWLKYDTYAQQTDAK